MPISASENTVTITHQSNSNTSVSISLFGATTLSWKVNGEEKLWLSEKAILDGTKAVRGGIPIVFPRFGPPNPDHAATKALPQHGFARNSKWEFLGQVDPHSAQFGLSPDQLTSDFEKQWPFQFKAILTFTLKETSLDLKFEVENDDTKPWDFTFLCHTYFKIPEISKVEVDGLQKVTYYDQLTKKSEVRDSTVTFDQELDQIYYDVPSQLRIKSENTKLFKIQTNSNLSDAVVWNPWIEKSGSMADFAPHDGYKNMVCVESGHVKKFETLLPKEKWTASVEYTAEN